MELWRSFGTIDVKFKCILVGTHSGGAQRVCYNLYENRDFEISIVAGRYSIDSFLPENLNCPQKVRHFLEVRKWDLQFNIQLT